METISIQVPISVAKAYNISNNEVKRHVQMLINAHLQNILNPKLVIDRLNEIMDATGKEAQANGFTPDMLPELLKDDE
jgi:hypothetical protein